MPATDFSRLPDDARVWVFTAAAPLSAAHAETLLARVDSFLAGWNAHGTPVVGARDLVHGRFLVVGADERASGVSGCSIDTLYHALRDAEAAPGTTLLDGSLVAFRDGDGEVRTLPRAQFRERVRAGEVGEDTPVFDTVSTVGDLRAGRWERPFREAWHAKAFPLGAGRA